MVHTMHLSIAERSMDGALIHLKCTAVAMAMMEQMVGILTNHVDRIPAQNTFSSRVYKGSLAPGIEPIDTFAHRTKNQAVLLLDALKNLTNPLPSHVAQSVLAARLSTITSLLQKVAALHRQDNFPAFNRPGRNLHRYLPQLQVHQQQIVRPSLALGQDLIGKTYPERESPSQKMAKGMINHLVCGAPK